MPKFSYRAIDAAGRPVEGSIEAADAASASEQLAAAGMREIKLEAAPVESPPESLHGRGLRAADSPVVAEHVSRMAAAGLPLADGLEAAAREIPGGRLSAGFKRLANRLRAGQSLDEALEQEGKAFPSSLRGIIQASVATSRPGETLDEFIRSQRRAFDAQRRLLMALAYPMFIAFMLLLVLNLFVFVVFHNVDLLFGESGMYSNFAAEAPPTPMVVSYKLVRALRWILPPLTIGFPLVALVLIGASSTRRVGALLKRIPIVGPVVRWTASEELATFLATMIEAGIPLPAALEHSADAMHDADLASICRSMARAAADGRSLSACLGARRAFPRAAISMVVWGEQTQALPQSLRSLAEIFATRAEARIQFIRVLAPAVMFFTVAITMALMFGLFMSPLIQVISTLA